MHGQREDWPERDPDEVDALQALLQRMPPEVIPQLDMNLELLDSADAFHDAFPDEFKIQLAAMTGKRAHEQYVAALAILPPVTRARIRRCVAWLKELAELSSQQEERSADAAPRQLRQVVLRLASFLVFLGMA